MKKIGKIINFDWKESRKKYSISICIIKIIIKKTYLFIEQIIFDLQILTHKQIYEQKVASMWLSTTDKRQWTLNSDIDGLEIYIKDYGWNVGWVNNKWFECCN